MDEVENVRLIELRQEVTALMGQCILKLQSYELGLKRFLTTAELKVTAGEATTDVWSQRKQKFARLTLGQLMNEFAGIWVSPESAASSETEFEDEPPVECTSSTQVEVKFPITLTKSDQTSLAEGLSELVNLRNELVHHFLVRHPLQDEADCVNAKAYLTEAKELIDQNIKKLKDFFSERALAVDHFKRLVGSSELSHLLKFGFVPDQPIVWSQTQAVALLQSAESKLRTNGWTELRSAIDWIQSVDAEITPKVYGCSSWRELLHHSSMFEIRRDRQEHLPTKTFYRSR